MTAMEKKARQAKNEFARALARWDNEGGAAPTKAAGPTKLAKAEERILQCLGAAVIVQWNNLPTDIQKQLFQHAVSMGEPRNVGRLKEEIARFLHKHKDDAAETA